MNLKFLLKSLVLCSICFSLANTETITNITVDGNKRIDYETILQYINKKVGDDVNDNDLNELVKKLNNTGLFSDVKIKKRKGKLLIEVIENSTVNKIRFEGNKKLKTDDIATMLKDMLIKPNETLSPKKVKMIQMALLEIYRKLGIYNATVDVKIIKRKNNQVDLIFVINENKPTKIHRIIFIGNNKIPTSDLKGAILSKENKWFRFFAQDDKYDEIRIEMDKKNIEHYYKKHGFAQAEVKYVSVELNKERTGLVITFTIDEGEVFKFGNIKLESKVKNLNINNLKYKKRCKTGKPFNIDLLALDQTSIINEVNKKGFIAVDIDPSFKYNKETKTIDVVLNIKEVERQYISKIIIRGNDKTRDSVIRREFPFEEGDLYSQSLLDTADGNIKSTGFFEGVDIRKHQDPISPDKCIIETNVMEARTGMLQFTGSYSTSDGPMVSLGYGEQNFLGTGKSVQLSLNAGRSLIGPSYGINGEKLKRKKQFEMLKSANFTISDSHLFGRDLTGSFSLFKYTSSPFDNFLLKNYGASIDLSYQLGEYLTQSWDLGISRRIVDHVDENCSPLIKAHLVKYDSNTKEFKMNKSKKGILTSLQTSFSYLHPIYDGPFRGRLNFKWTTALLHDNGFNSSVWKNILSASYLKPLTRKVSLTLQGSYGMLTPIGRRDINMIDSFTTNIDSIRGFDEGSCCPHFVTAKKRVVNNKEDNKELIPYVNAAGAKKFINGTVSLSFPIGLPTELNFRTFIFTDFGYYWDPIIPNNYKDILEEQEGYEEITYKDNKIKVNKASCEAENKLNNKDKDKNKEQYILIAHQAFSTDGFGISIGIGCSFDTPFGPITLSWAIPIKKCIFDKKRIFNFGMKAIF